MASIRDELGAYRHPQNCGCGEWSILRIARQAPSIAFVAEGVCPECFVPLEAGAMDLGDRCGWCGCCGRGWALLDGGREVTRFFPVCSGPDWVMAETATVEH